MKSEGCQCSLGSLIVAIIETTSLLAETNFYLQTKIKSMMELQVPTLSCFSLFPMTEFVNFSLMVYAQLQTPRCCSPDLFYTLLWLAGT